MKEYLSDFRKLHIQVRKKISDSFLGNFKSAFRGNGLSFEEFQTRQDGDDASMIDWLVSAREGRILVREMEEDREISVIFFLDISKSMLFGVTKSKLDIELETFFMLSSAALKEGSKVGIIIFGGEEIKFFNFAKSSHILFQVYSYIQEQILLAKYKTNFSDAMDFFLKLRYRRKLIFLITDKEDILDLHLQQLSYTHELNYIQILTDFENTLHLGQAGTFSFSGDKNVLNIDISDDKTREKFIRYRYEKLQRLKRKIFGLGAFYILLCDIDTVYQKMLIFMKQKNLKN